jgi:tetratricopeptide (TPR) repeat protein
MKASALLVLAGLLSVFGSARRSAREGEKQYRAKNYAASRRAFEDAVRAEPGDPLWKFDAGTAGAAGGDGNDAEAARRELEAAARAPDPRIAAAARYQLGTLDLGDKRYAEAVRNLRRSLELDPGRADAKRNLEIALAAASEPPPPREGGQSPPRPSPGSQRASPDREFEKRAGMSRAQAEALLRSLDDEQKRRERAGEPAAGKDW